MKKTRNEKKLALIKSSITLLNENATQQIKGGKTASIIDDHLLQQNADSSSLIYEDHVFL